MAIKPSGPIGLGTDLPAEFGGTAPFSLSQYYRGGGRVPDAPQNAAVPTSGTISLGEFYNTINVLTLTITGTVSNYNLYNEFVAKYGTPSAAVPVRLDIAAGAVVGGVGTYALNIGQFPAGTTIDIYNNGQILAYGGAPNSGTGGDAVYAAYGGQVMRFYNQSGALCYGGGGGGGHGGNGGQGGGGYYNDWVSKGASGCNGGTFELGCDGMCQVTFGGGAKCRWSYNNTPGQCWYGCQSWQACGDCLAIGPIYTSGGGGGGGGNGGAGQGFNQAKGGGDPGAGGSAGGTNAGTGGTGGHGGAGGDWGVGGNTGDQGGTGANGNNGSGQAGTSGSGGGGGGRYYVRGGADFTFTNNGGATAGGIG